MLKNCCISIGFNLKCGKDETQIGGQKQVHTKKMHWKIKLSNNTCLYNRYEKVHGNSELVEFLNVLLYKTLFCPQFTCYFYLVTISTCWGCITLSKQDFIFFIQTMRQFWITFFFLFRFPKVLSLLFVSDTLSFECYFQII